MSPNYTVTAWADQIHEVAVSAPDEEAALRIGKESLPAASDYSVALDGSVMVLKPNPDVLRRCVAEEIAKVRDAELVECPNCLGEGVIPRPWPSLDPDPVECPTCEQSGRVSPEVRDEWLGWQNGGEPA